MGEPSRLAPELRRALDRLSRVDRLRAFYLASGTAVAWHLNHRTSRDLDLFSRDAEANLEAIRVELTQREEDLVVLAETEVSLRVRCGGVPVDLVRYPYPPLATPRSGPAGFGVAGREDLAAMKLAAIARRGLRRDFWDLYALATLGGVALRAAISAYRTRYGVAASDLYHVLRALTYFDEAEADPVLPRGLTIEHWRTIRAWFEREAPQLLAE